ncbi:hypothetical protein B0J13DRAFT_34205 [Dactylonectria estremocensis]|uniref:Uncharacterized protein n=1 Tax=Dactylonectria estremocensis TaxID=1079267 RepID=A0A9P9FKA7_9HYPO|nr:hypothetical protein B0J13DRAFT_34205 [Dactylonectria estremocensis]
MANGFDRLERFFTKRKVSNVSADSIEPVITTDPSTTEPQFPSPSFIRPKATRMAAREEVIVKQPGSIRSPSVVDAYSPQRTGSIQTQSPTYSSESYRLQYSPIRTSSLRHLQGQCLRDGFGDFHFPRPPTVNGEISPVSSTHHQMSLFELSGQRSPRSHSPQKAKIGPDRLDTPPVSDLEDDDLSCPRYFRNKRLPELPHGALPTPGPSPELSPVRDSQIRESRPIRILNKDIYRDIHRQLHQSFEQPALRRTLSQSSLLLTTSRGSLSRSTLREPDVVDFLNLSDDDIAEISPDSPVLSSESDDSPTDSTVAAATSSRQHELLLTLTPPYASRPATAAAFEAARIASRYNFDLVYVVNLWPDISGPPTSGPEASFDSNFSAKPSKGMTGRLLAAYGLHNVKSPFQIHSDVHGKILRAGGWIEYRNQEARSDEFARGYACAFYTGQYSRSGSIGSSTSSSSTRMRQNDRGIVFAAYKKPRSDGGMVGVDSNKPDLADVYRDAEALVEMLIDIHVASRLRQPLSPSDDTEETGPMPLHPPNRQ